MKRLFRIACILGALALVVAFSVLAWLTPQYPDSEKSALGNCDGYGSFFYSTSEINACPRITGYYDVPTRPDSTTAMFAGSPRLHPVSWATTILHKRHAIDDPEQAQEMREYLETLLLHAHITPRGNLVYPYLFDFSYDYEMSPWYSPMAQGLAGAAFMAGWRVFGDERYFDAAIKSIESIRAEGDHYAFYRITQNGVWLQEYPHSPYAVLDGSLIAVIGIHDVWKSLPGQHPLKPIYKDLWQAALQGVKDEWQRFKAPYGIYFEDSKRRVTPEYYTINMAALRYLGVIDPAVEDIRKQLIMPEGWLPRYAATVSGAFFKITRAWWPHVPLGQEVTRETLPDFAKFSYAGSAHTRQELVAQRPCPRATETP